MFTKTEWDTLQQLADTLVPPDDYPGGWEGARGYLIHALQTHLQAALPEYRAALCALEEEARQRTGNAFAQLPLEEREQLLAELEQNGGKAPWPMHPARFIARAAQHVAEGCYANPENGGNPKGVFWQMIGYEVTG